MNIEKQLETAVKTNHLVLVVFYADWSPHYEWIGPVLRTYEKRTVELIRVNAEENRTIADAHNVETVPAFLLLHKGHELWRQMCIRDRGAADASSAGAATTSVIVSVTAATVSAAAAFCADISVVKQHKMNIVVAIHNFTKLWLLYFVSIIIILFYTYYLLVML